jgi:hypothetical protein
MTNWKATLDHNGAPIELILKAKTYADAFIIAQEKYPAARITSIKPIGPVINKKKK